MTTECLTRRAFLAATTTTAALAALGSRTQVNAAQVVPGKISPNEKLNIAGIGGGGKGVGDIRNCAGENIVAIADVDWERAGQTFERCPGARRYWDYRKMLEEMGDGIDAVTISTPDHMHAPAAYQAIRMGKHVYVQKPLTHTVAEARLLGAAAKEAGVTTQMGNQGSSSDGHFQLQEVLGTGVAGEVHTVHTWTDRPGTVWPQGIPEPLPEQPVRDQLDWDLWIGGAPARPYNEGYCPRKWRAWWDFGCGALGDMGCHNINPVWEALRLYEATTIAAECVKQDGRNSQTGPHDAVIRYELSGFSGRGPVTYYWYDGGLMPDPPEGIDAGSLPGGNGSLILGSDAAITCGGFGGGTVISGDAKDTFETPAPTLERVEQQNHHGNWLNAIKSGKPGTSDFRKAVPLTEMVLLGNIALRVEGRFEYKTESGTIDGHPQASALLSKTYRAGWELPV